MGPVLHDGADGDLVVARDLHEVDVVFSQTDRQIGEFLITRDADDVGALADAFYFVHARVFLKQQVRRIVDPGVGFR